MNKAELQGTKICFNFSGNKMEEVDVGEQDLN